MRAAKELCRVETPCSAGAIRCQSDSLETSRISQHTIPPVHDLPSHRILLSRHQSTHFQLHAYLVDRVRSDSVQSLRQELAYAVGKRLQDLDVDILKLSQQREELRPIQYQ